MKRVLVVDDSPRLRSVIGNALAATGYDVVGTGGDVDALEAVSETDPDVAILSLESTGRDGLETIDRLMTASPTPTLVLDSDGVDADAAFGSLAHGAVNVLERPAVDDSRAVAAFVDDLGPAVDDLAAVDVSALAVAQTAATARSIRATGAAMLSSDSASTDAAGRRPTGAGRSADAVGRSRTPIDVPTIVVGASTGGPKVVERLLADLPTDLEARVFVVQHMPADFTPRFAARLDAKSEYPVREARDGERVQPGTAVVAPGDAHLGVAIGADGTPRIRLEDGDRRHGARPSIDVTMERVAEQVDGPLCGVVLTGMGRDGAAGIEAIAAAGGHTIAQDEATSPVFGIPDQAIRTGCVDEVVGAADLADRIVAAVGGEADE